MKKTIIFSLIIGTMLLAACQAKANTGIYEERAVMADSYMAAPQMSAPVAEMPATVTGSAEGGAGSYTNTASAGNVKIVIKTASMSIVVLDVAGTMQQITSISRLYGGDVTYSNLYQTVNYEGVQISQGDITISVKAEQLDQAMTDVRALVADAKTDINSENISSEDVTSTYVDLQSRKRNYENAADKLTDLMDEATKTEDALNVFNQLMYIQEQIEVLQGQISYYEHSAKLSTITISVQEKSTIAPVTASGWQPLQTLRDAAQYLVRILQSIADFLMKFIVIIGPFFLILVFLPWLFTWLCLKKKGWTRKGLRFIRPLPVPPPMPAQLPVQPAAQAKKK